jgi:hypothetical protein
LSNQLFLSSAALSTFGLSKHQQFNLIDLAMKTQLIFLLLISSLSSIAQVTLKGSVKDAQGNLLPGVNVYIEGSYNGCSSDENGCFSFSTAEKGMQKLMASFIGYITWTKTVELSDAVTEEIILRESINTLDAVTITAGTFAAADKKRAAILDPIDIYTTASANGDVMAAMRTMPGTQSAADDGRLLVRGGDAYESKTYIDGLLTAKPYFSKTPDVATRGRFSPSLFNGVQFSSGGYSAEYGQALSSVLTLNSNDIAVQDVTGLSLMTIGVDANTTKAKPNNSYMLSGGYTNLAPFHALFKSNLNWIKPVESVNLSGTYRYKPNSHGMLKVFANTDYGRLSYEAPEGEGRIASLDNSGGSFYSNISYNDCLSKKSCYRIGLATTFDADSIQYNQYNVGNREFSAESRFTIITVASENLKLNYGICDTYLNYHQRFSVDSTAIDYKLNFEDHTLGSFIEGEYRFSKNFAIRPGCRAEYSSILNKMNFSPRLAFALSTGKNSQLSAAWGRYYQNPESDYLKFNTNLKFEDATHYIVSFQSGDTKSRLFRTELYYKKYNNLVTWQGNNETQPRNISNGGNGHAAGIDIFWRDKVTVKSLDFWVTYSYVDTKRLYRNFSVTATPDFVSKHNGSFVAKYWIHGITTQVGAAYTVASGRKYDDPNTSEFMDKTTGWYNDLSLNLSKVFFAGDQYSVFYVSVTNVLGRDNVFGYRPSSQADAQGNYELIPEKKDTKRFIFMGLMLSF